MVVGGWCLVVRMVDVAGQYVVARGDFGLFFWRRGLGREGGVLHMGVSRIDPGCGFMMHRGLAGPWRWMENQPLSRA